jgi:hypothetical protein
VTAHRGLLGWKDRRVSEWVLFMHPPRDDFIATMTDAERSAFGAHAGWLRKLLAEYFAADTRVAERSTCAEKFQICIPTAQRARRGRC